MGIFTWFGKVANSIASFVSKVVTVAPGVVIDIEHALATAAQVANNLVNGLKAFAATPEGKLLEDVITSIVPAQWVADIVKYLPIIIQDLGWATAEFNKSSAQLVTEGIQKVLAHPNPDVIATHMASLQAHINTKVASLQGVTVPVQASLSQAHVVYLGLPDSDVDPNAQAA